MEQISQTRITKELEILARMESKHIKINFSNDHKSLEVNHSVKGVPVTYYITLPERYPFLPPKVTADVPSELQSVYQNSGDLLDLVLEDCWTPAISLSSLIEKVILFSNQTLTTSKFHGLGQISLVSIVCVALTFRFALFSQSYSGHYTPPLYGDYEAQRHWMELTTNYPIEDWYRAEPEYWKLDYPPLTAWHSFVCGLLSKLWEPESVQLGVSRGYYSLTHLAFMRFSVLVSELLVYLPAVLLYFHRAHWQLNEKVRNVALIAVLMSPPLILIDYGHFQYNNVMLGFALMSVVLTDARSFSMAAAALALSFNFKIMGLYYFFPLVAYWLAGVYDRSYRGRLRNGPELAALTQVYLFISAAFAVAAAGFVTSCLIWTPWLSWDEGLEVLGRVFPFDRGVFEDKVATFWCISSILIKYKQLFSIRTMSVLTSLATVLLSAPWVYLTVSKRKLKKSLTFGLAGVSLTFFLFSYHVHEKTILVPLLPLMLLTVFEYPDLFEVLVVTGTFSMYPLLVLDRLKLPYFVFQALFLAVSKINKDNLKTWVNVRSPTFVYIGIVLVHFTEFVDVPAYPYFFKLIVAAYSFVVFAFAWSFLLVQFYRLKHDSDQLGRSLKDKTK